jgi:hypothetical protein
MNVRWELGDLPAHIRAQIEPAKKPAAKPRKYRNEPVWVDDIRFDSKLEADRYEQLKALWNYGAGVVRWFVRQVPFDCGGGVVYKADFVIVWQEGEWSRVTVEDCKGLLLQDCINKLKQVRSRYGLTVDMVTREEGRLAVRPWRE